MPQLPRGLRAAALAASLAAAGSVSAQRPAPPPAEPIAILFVGNSFTFGRVDPVMSYNAARVHDLTRPQPERPDPNFTDTTGANPWEPHPWGGVPGIFKQLTDHAGLNYDVSLSTRNAASLRGHYLNTANADWDLRGNIASRRWDVVMLQEQSDVALPAGRGGNANLPQFNAYVDKIERYVHVGAAESYRERAMYTALHGSVAGCVAAGGTASSCDNNALRTIPANPNANPGAEVYLTQTWARPNMVFPNLQTVADENYPTVPDGRPIVDTSDPAFPDGYPRPTYYDPANGMAAMTADLHASAHARVAANPGLAGVVPVGDAFQRALDQGVAKSSGFYDAAGVVAPEGPHDPPNLWWLDGLHASKYGSYLSALVIFGTVTRIDPWSLGAQEKAAEDLGISRVDAMRLQQVASEQLAQAGIPLRRLPCLRGGPKPGKGCH